MAGRPTAAGAVIGVAGTVVALVALGGGLLGTEPLGAPRTPGEVVLAALEMLVGGTALGGVLLAGRRVSPWAPLTSALLWAAGSVVVLADPAVLARAGLDSAATLFGHQLGLGLTGLMLLGALALRPAPAEMSTSTRLGPGRSPALAPPARAVPDPWDTDPDIPAVRPVPALRPSSAVRPAHEVRPVTAFRTGPQRPDGPGPRHRAPARRSGPVPAPRWSPPAAAPRPRRRAG